MSEKRNLIIFVCTANICRSPMAERLFRHAIDVEEEPLKSLKVISAGVSSIPGQAPSLNSVKALERVGISLANHESKAIDQDVMDRAVAIFCMTESHRSMIEMYADPVPQNLYLMRELIPNIEDPEISDPYGMSLSLYENCRDSMVEAIPSLVSFVKTLLAKFPEQFSSPN